MTQDNPKKRDFINYVVHNTYHVDPAIGVDEDLIPIGTPSHNTVPYDTYARLMARDAEICFKRARIPAEVHSCHRHIHGVGRGSGFGGAVRFGDDMLPPDVKAIVAKADEERARQAWEDYQGRKFMRKPHFVVRGKWFNRDAPLAGTPTWHSDAGAWVREGWWEATIRNAIHIARVMNRDTTRLESYLERCLTKKTATVTDHAK